MFCDLLLPPVHTGTGTEAGADPAATATATATATTTTSVLARFQDLNHRVLYFSSMLRAHPYRTEQRLRDIAMDAHASTPPAGSSQHSGGIALLQRNYIRFQGTQVRDVRIDLEEASPPSIVRTRHVLLLLWLLLLLLADKPVASLFSICLLWGRTHTHIPVGRWCGLGNVELDGLAAGLLQLSLIHI